MLRNVIDVVCAIAIFAIVVFLGSMGEKPKSDTWVHRPTEFEVFKSTAPYGILQLFCVTLGAVKLIRCVVETRKSKLASPALLSGIRKQLDEGQIDQALSQAKSDTGYAGRVLAAALGRKSAGGDVRRGFEDAAAFECSRLSGTADTLLAVGVIGFLVGLLGAIHGLTYHLLLLQTKKSPTFDEVTYTQEEILARLTYGTIIALIFVPAFLLVRRRVLTKVAKVNVELGALLDRAALQKPIAS
jgi:hypothetical protein